MIAAPGSAARRWRAVALGANPGTISLRIRAKWALAWSASSGLSQYNRKALADSSISPRSAPGRSGTQSGGVAGQGGHLEGSQPDELLKGWAREDGALAGTFSFQLRWLAARALAC